MNIVTESPPCAGFTRKITRKAPSYIEHNARTQTSRTLRTVASREKYAQIMKMDDATSMSRDWLALRCDQARLMNELALYWPTGSTPESVMFTFTKHARRALIGVRNYV